ncbi:MAG TPA: matrixin family metalloprotease [Candidatus Dormibacteraeota bacterium]|nr:matrixin family metalloprotease [Candidatus Dormibacteraeota bacterium]
MVVLAQAGLGHGVLSVAAFDNCANNNTCAWSQSDNHNWQPNQNQDPHCYNMCEMWQQNCADRLGYWNGYGGGVFQRRADWAVQTWNAVPECTPNYFKTGDSSAPISFVAASLGQNSCGLTSVKGYQNGSIFYLQQVTISVNSDLPYWDGPVPNGQHGCNLPTSLLHETGHSFGEGHSSVTSDVMYVTNDSNAMSIDADAHHMLAATYGYNSPNSCESCHFTLDFGLTPPIHQQSVPYFQQAVTDKVNAAVGAAQSTEQDAADKQDYAVQYANSVCYINRNQIPPRCAN